MPALLLLWSGLLLASPPAVMEALVTDSAAPVVARVRLGAGDAAGQRLFGRALHRRRILRGEVPAPRAERLDLHRWLISHGAVLHRP